MDYSVMHTLRDVAAINTALPIFYDSEIEKMLLEDEWNYQSMLIQEFSPKRQELWTRIQTLAVEKMRCLPTTLHSKVYSFIQPLHIEVEDWIRDHRLLLDLDETSCRLAYKRILLWKFDGTINREETAKAIVRNQNIDPNVRFRMACTYFLEDELMAIWREEKEVNSESLYDEKNNIAVRFWMEWIRQGAVGPWELMVDDYFRDPCFKGSDIHLRFSCFLPYLSPESRSNYLQRFRLGFPSYMADEFFFCLSSVEQTDRTKFFKLMPQAALVRCLRWPFQSLFLKMAIRLLSYMYEYNFYYVLAEIIRYIMLGPSNFDYVQLFKDFWDLSPDSLKALLKSRRVENKLIKTVLDYDERSQPLPLQQLLNDCINAESNTRHF